MRLAGWLLAMIALGLALGAAQLIPLYELVRQSFREGSASLQQVRDWAWPSRQIITFLLPDFFGNPDAPHLLRHLAARSWVPVTQNALGEPLNTIDWGVKNYVEGGNYLGLLTAAAGGDRRGRGDPPVRGRAVLLRLRQTDGARARLRGVTHSLLCSSSLAVLSLLFAFGTPLYAVLYYLLPGYSQLHSAFRWVFPYTLAWRCWPAIGLDWLLIAAAGRQGSPAAEQRWAGLAVVAAGRRGRCCVGRAGQRLRARAVRRAGRSHADWGSGRTWPERSGFAERRDGVELRSGPDRALGADGVAVGRRAAAGHGSRRHSEADETDAATLAGAPWPGHALLACCFVLILDLWLFGHGFNPAVDPEAARLQAAGRRSGCRSSRTRPSRGG